MPGEKQNEVKAKLDEMSTLPEGFCFNPEQTWQRLDEQLNRSKKKNFAWLYAAAIILLIVGSFFVIQDASQNRNIAVPIHYPSINSNVKAIVQPKKEEQANNVIVHYVPTAKKISHSIVKVEQTKPVVDSIVVEQPIAVLPSVIKSDTVSKTIAIAKPKFRVAHINELNANEPVFDLPNSKTSTALLHRRNFLELNESPGVEEKAISQRKQKALFSFLISSSQ